jgi:hypothetical protein
MYGIRQQDFQGYEFLERNLELSLKIKFDFISFVDKSPELNTLLIHALHMYSDIINSATRLVRLLK